MVALELVGAVGGITQSVARVLGLSKSARLRRAINDHVKLYASLEGRSELKEPALHLAALIELQTRQLYLREVIAANRIYDWSQPIIGIAVAAICAIPLYLMFPPHNWWQWVTSGILGILVLAFVAAGIGGFRKQPTLEELAAAAEQVEAENSPSSDTQSQSAHSGYTREN
jgi:hypothetical protein